MQQDKKDDTEEEDEENKVRRGHYTGFTILYRGVFLFYNFIMSVYLLRASSLLNFSLMFHQLCLDIIVTRIKLVSEIK